MSRRSSRASADKPLAGKDVLGREAGRDAAMTQRFQLFLPDPVLTRLEMEAQRTGRSKADIIREALERYFAQGSTHPRALASIVGTLDSGGGSL